MTPRQRADHLHMVLRANMDKNDVEMEVGFIETAITQAVEAERQANKQAALKRCNHCTPDGMSFCHDNIAKRIKG